MTVMTKNLVLGTGKTSITAKFCQGCPEQIHSSSDDLCHERTIEWLCYIKILKIEFS